MSERSIIGRHAFTVLVGQLAVMAFGITDTVVAGRHGAASLAALSVGSAFFISVYVASNGVLQALLPVWAEQQGARETASVGRSLRQALYLWAALSMLGVLVLLSPGPVLRWTEVPPALQEDVQQYLAILALALPPGLLFRVFSTLNQSLGRPRLVTWLQMGSLCIKVPLSIWFTFGGGGLPSLGVAGCAWATLAVNVSMLAMAVWLLRTQPLYAPLQIWKRPEAPHWPTLRGFARLGIPAGLAVLVEVTSFTLMALFIARQGTTASAAHQIASNITAVLYMVPLSLGIATSARVSFWLGAQQADTARSAALIGFRLTALISIGLSALLLIAKDHIGALYSSHTSVVSMAAGVLAWVAAYHMADALQTVCVFVLRCYRITVAPLVIYCALLWGAGLGGGYWLAYGMATPLVPGWASSPTPFWAAGVLALATTATLFIALLWKALRPSAPQHASAWRGS